MIIIKEKETAPQVALPLNGYHCCFTTSFKDLHLFIMHMSQLYFIAGLPALAKEHVAQHFSAEALK